MSGSGPPKIGLLAGWGRYPIVVAQALREQGHQVFGLGIKDHADPCLAEYCHDYREVGLGKMGAAIRHFRRNGVTQATMLGKIHKVRLFQKFAILKHFPDWRCLRTFYPHWVTKAKDRRDDTLLAAVVEAFAKDGIHFAPATDFVPELLVKHGKLTGRSPSSGQWKDIEFGWRLAKEMGRLDIGQSVAVKGQAVLAVEAVEGTDECIRRAGNLCPQGGFTVVKVAKPQQDMRFDVPTIGMETMKTLVQAGASVLAIEAEKTIVVDRPQVIEFGKRHKLTIVAVGNAQFQKMKRAA
jgi:DUF1009 family protein